MKPEDRIEEEGIEVEWEAETSLDRGRNRCAGYITQNGIRDVGKLVKES